MVNKLKKILILGLLSIVVSNVFLLDMGMSFSAPKVYAVSEQTPGQAKQAGNGGDEAGQNMKNAAEFLNNMNHVLYVLIWPMLALAGISMDNQFVYGSFFKLDIALWKFWTMTRTFANYVLGFFFIVSIFLYFFKFKEDKNDPRKLIPKILVAAVLIQSSWFLLGALVDLSTIATYALGALPLKAVQGTDLGKSPLLLPNVTIDLSNSGQLSKDNFNMGTFVGGNASSPKKYGICDYKDGTFKKMDDADADADGSYCVYSHPKFNWILVSIGSSKETVDKDEKAKENSDNVLKGTGTDDNALSLQNIIKFGKGMTGPFYALYASLMNMISISASNKSAGTLTTEFLLKSMVTFALLAPLFALAVVMVMRIVILWLYIGFSPLIALQAALDFKGLKNDKMGSKFEISTVLGMVFMPVTAVFALSISIIFLSALMRGPAASTGSGAGPWSAMGVSIDTQSGNPGKTCLKIDKMDAKLCVTNKENDISISTFFNMFSRIMVNLFGIALMRTIVFAALKTSKITKGVVDSIQNFAEGTLKATPFIPIPGVGTVGAGALKTGMQQLGQMPGRLQNENYEKTLGKIFNKGGGDSGGGNGNRGSEFDKAMNKAGRGGFATNEAQILDGFNKTFPNAKANNVDEMMSRKEFREYMANNKDKLNVLNTDAMKKFANHIMSFNDKKEVLTNRTGLQYFYIPSERNMYKVEGIGSDKKVTNIVNMTSPAKNEIDDFIQNMTANQKSQLDPAIPTEFTIGNKKYEIDFNTNPKSLKEKP